MNLKREVGFRKQISTQKANAKLGATVPTSSRHERRKAAKLARVKK